MDRGNRGPVPPTVLTCLPRLRIYIKESVAPLTEDVKRSSRTTRTPFSKQSESSMVIVPGWKSDAPATTPLGPNWQESHQVFSPGGDRRSCNRGSLNGRPRSSLTIKADYKGWGTTAWMVRRGLLQ